MSLAAARIHADENVMVLKYLRPCLQGEEVVQCNYDSTIETHLVILARCEVGRKQNALWVDVGEELEDMLNLSWGHAFKAKSCIV